MLEEKEPAIPTGINSTTVKMSGEKVNWQPEQHSILEAKQHNLTISDQQECSWDLAEGIYVL